jgi:hypothetical protein
VSIERLAEFGIPAPGLTSGGREIRIDRYGY